MIFLQQPADPFDSVDPEWELRTDDYRDTGISIQDCRSYGGGFGVNEAEYDPQGNLCAMIHHPDCKTLDKAKKAALALYAQKRST